MFSSAYKRPDLTNEEEDKVARILAFARNKKNHNRLDFGLLDTISNLEKYLGYPPPPPPASRSGKNALLKKRAATEPSRRVIAEPPRGDVAKRGKDKAGESSKKSAANLGKRKVTEASPRISVAVKNQAFAATLLRLVDEPEDPDVPSLKRKKSKKPKVDSGRRSLPLFLMLLRKLWMAPRRIFL